MALKCFENHLWELGNMWGVVTDSFPSHRPQAWHSQPGCENLLDERGDAGSRMAKSFVQQRRTMQSGLSNQDLVGPSVLLNAVDPPKHHHLALPAHSHCMEVHWQRQLNPQPATIQDQSS